MLHRMSASIGHTEVFIGQTAYGIFALNEEQRIDIREVSKSFRVTGRTQHSQHRLCITRRTDDEIVEYLKHNWHGAYCTRTKNCRMGSDLIIRFVCGKPIPWRLRSIERLSLRLLRLYERLDQGTMGQKLFSKESSLWKKAGRRLMKPMVRHRNEHWEIRIDDDRFVPGDPRPSMCPIRFRRHS
jgi:hypothetical protein